MDGPPLSPAQPQPFDVPWRIRDPIYVILCSFLVIFTLQLMVGFVLASSLAYQGIHPTKDILEEIFQAPLWADLWRLLDMLLMILFMLTFMFQHGAIDLHRMFARGQVAWEARYSLSVFLMSVLYTVLLGLTIVLLIFGAALLFRQDPHVWMDAYHRQSVKEVISRISPQAGWFRILLFTVVGPPLEEVLFRGGFYGALRKGWGPWKANFASSLLFALLHFYLVGFSYVFLLGILTAYAYERTRSLTAPILAHMLWNGFVTAASRPIVWPVFAIAVLLLALWGSRAKGECPFGDGARRPGLEKISWKVYAWFFVGSMVWGSMGESRPVLYLLAELPIYLAVVSYAYEQVWFPRKWWIAYGLFYIGYTSYDFWALSSRLSHKASPESLAADVVVNTLIMLPSMIVLWRLIRGEGRVDALSPAVLK